jgi:hypothetical protein
MDGLLQSDNPETAQPDEVLPQVRDGQILKGPAQDVEPESEASSTVAPGPEDEAKALEKKKLGPRRLVEEETRAVGRISRDIWGTYILACGGRVYWSLFVIAMVLAAASPVLENGWLK